MSPHLPRCTHMYGTPTMYVDMVNVAQQRRHDVSTLYSGIVAGAPVPFHLMQAIVSDLNMRDSVVSGGGREGGGTGMIGQGSSRFRDEA